jgi:O-antigen biosynthesis protein
MSSSTVKLSVIIVNYNVEHFLEQCIQSVVNASRTIATEIIVVDNSSVDGSVAMLKNKFPQVKLIANHQNKGFSSANNQGIKVATGSYLLLLNPDTVVQEDTFLTTLQFMDDHNDAGALGVMMVDGKGNFLPESKRGLPTPAVAFYKVFGLSKLFPTSKTFGQYHVGYLDKNKIHEVDILSGAFMLLRKTVLTQIGLLDETFFMYGEDIDLSYRVQLAGYRNYYFPETRIIHYKGESTKKSSINYVVVFYSAMQIFAKKHFAKERATLFSALIFFAIVFRASLALLKRLIEQLFIPLLDAALLYAGLVLIKNYYEQNIKFTSGGNYPENLVRFAFALYALIWIGSVFIRGGYDKPIRLQKIMRGIFAGTALILSLYALLPEEYRFSRALILIGTGWAMASLLGSRMLFHLIGIKSFVLEGSHAKRIAIVGNQDEYKRILSLLKESSIHMAFAGHVSPDAEELTAPSSTYLGQFHQLEDILHIYKIDEVIFAAKNLSAEKIIDAMSTPTHASVEFKIAPQESFSIIGSNSINTAGDLYTLDVNSVHKPSNQRKKRVIDIAFSLLVIATLPFLVWIVKNPLHLIGNAFKVLLGFRTWVGIPIHPSAFNSNQQIHKGILSPSDAFSPNQLSTEMSDRLNKIYVKDYSAKNDITILFKGIRRLGNVHYRK